MYGKGQFGKTRTLSLPSLGFDLYFNFKMYEFICSRVHLVTYLLKLELWMVLPHKINFKSFYPCLFFP